MWSLETVPEELLRLGPPALARLLDSADAVYWPTEMEWRDYGPLRQHGIAAFARVDLDAVLRAMKRRRWTAARVALSGIGLLRDARVVPFLVRASGDASPGVRARAVESLGLQRDEAATAAVLRALRDRSSDVKRAAVRALGSIGDPRAIEPLEAARARNPGLADEAAQALRTLRAAGRSTAPPEDAPPSPGRAGPVAIIPASRRPRKKSGR